MILPILIVIAVVLLIWQFQRAKKFEAKDLKDVITKTDVKAFLNIPHEKAHFAEDLEQTRASSKPSRSILDEFNKL